MRGAGGSADAQPAAKCELTAKFRLRVSCMLGAGLTGPQGLVSKHAATLQPRVCVSAMGCEARNSAVPRGMSQIKPVRVRSQRWCQMRKSQLIRKEVLQPASITSHDD